MHSLFKRFFRKRKKAPLFADLSGKTFSDAEYNRICREQNHIAMKLLEKINRKGMSGLSEKERQFLEDFSRSNYANQAYNDHVESKSTK